MFEHSSCKVKREKKHKGHLFANCYQLMRQLYAMQHLFLEESRVSGFFFLVSGIFSAFMIIYAVHLKL
jgi:hypothetical protein